MNSIIEIHEFSTGIEIFGTHDDWSIGGFTGNYLNSTLPSVPSSVQNAISSKYFAVAEGASSDKPVVIGREISGIDGGFSVLVTVIKGIEKNRRSAPLYRYFLCEGMGNIRHILQWMNTEKGKILPFDPFDQQFVGYPHQYQISHSNPINLRPELENLLFNNSLPIIVPSHEPCPPLILNQMAHRLGSPVSWAYKVRAVAKPTSFQIIQPADRDSETIINRAIATTPKQSQIVMEEQQITTAIRGLISRDKFKPEHLSTIENNLDRLQIDNNYWSYLFDKQGAKDALENKTYAPQTIRLLTLRAIVLPETLPEFLSWIQESNNQKQHYQISTSFQNQIIQYLKLNNIPKLETRLKAGVIPMIPNLIQQSELLDSTLWLLGEDKGVWGYLYKKQVISNLYHDFVLIENNNGNIENASQQEFEILNHPAWEPILRALSRKNIVTEYDSIAEFFSKIGKIQQSHFHHKLLALFLFISQGEIPNKLYLYLKQKGSKTTRDGLKVKVYGFPLTRKIPLSEKLWQGTKDFMLFLWQKKIPIPLLIPFLASIILMFILGAKLSNNILSNNSPDSSKETSQKDNFSSENLLGATPNPPKNINSPITPKQLDEAMKKIDEAVDEAVKEFEEAVKEFETTRKVIGQIYDELNIKKTKNNNSNQTEQLNISIIEAMRSVLNPDNKFNLQYGAVIQNKPDLKDEKHRKNVTDWIKAIYNYQQRKNQENPSNQVQVCGCLIENGKTNPLLIEDIKNKLVPTINPPGITPPTVE